MKCTVLYMLIFGCLPLSAQKMPSHHAVEDLNFLIENLKKYNPALPHYRPDFDSLSTEVVKKMLSDSLSLFECHTLVSRVCALASEGHISIGDRNDSIRKGFFSDEYAYMPIRVCIVAGRLFVVSDYSDEQVLEEGDEIVSINGISAQIILNKLSGVIPSDGKILDHAYRRMEDSFSGYYFMHIEQPISFEITLVGMAGNARTVHVSALVRSDQSANFEEYSTDPHDDRTRDSVFYTLKIENDYAVLKLPSFDFRRVNHFRVRSKKMYKKIFQQLKTMEVEHFIVDLRNNTGGRSEFADDFVLFILDLKTKVHF